MLNEWLSVDSETSKQLDLFMENGRSGGVLGGGVIMCAHVQVGRIKCPQPVMATLKVHLQNSWLRLVPTAFSLLISSTLFIPLFPSFSIYLCCNSCMSSKPITLLSGNITSSKAGIAPRNCIFQSQWMLCVCHIPVLRMVSFWGGNPSTPFV